MQGFIRGCLLALGMAFLLGTVAEPVRAGGSFGHSPARKKKHKKTQHRKAKHRTAHKRHTTKKVVHHRAGARKRVHHSRVATASHRASSATSTAARVTGASAFRVGRTPAARVGGGKSSLYVLSVEVDCALVDKGAKDPDAVEATRLASVLRRKAAYKHVYTRVLLGKRASRAGILRGFTWLKKNMNPRDVAVIFISSHGGMDPLGFFGLFPAHYRWQKKAETALWAQEMREELLQTAGYKLVLIESCNSGAFLRAPAKLRPLPNAHIICSCRVLEGSGTSFGYGLPKGLSGAAADSKGVVTSDRLQRYLARQVRLSGRKQHISVSRPKGMPNLVLTRT
jgi:hypothetical protein